MSAFAADPSPKTSETVIVPYDPSKPVAQQQPDQFYLPYERFLELWEAAKKNRAGVQPVPAAASFALSTARYEGVVNERTVAFTGKLDVTTFNDSWVKVPLPFADVKVSALTIDGAAAAFDGAQIVVEKPGRHHIEVTFEIPLPPGAKAFGWGIPRSGATLVALTLSDARTRATITPGAGAIERMENGHTIVTAAIGSADRVEVALQPAAALALGTEPAVATIKTELAAMAGREMVRAWFDFAFPSARQDRFTVYLETGLTLFALEAPNLKSWRLRADGDRQALELVLNEPADEHYEFHLEADRPLADLPADLQTPVFSAAAKRLDFAAQALVAEAGLDVTPKPEAGLRQIPWKGVMPRTRVVAAFAGAGRLGYHAALAETKREARIDYVYQVNRRKIELLASFQLFAKGDDVFAATLALPAGFDVQAVQSERLQDWWRDGDTLRVRFKDTTPEMTPLVIYLVRQYAAAPTELDVRPLTLEGFKNVAGEAVIAAHKGVEAALKLSEEAKEITPEKAATDFQILPPLERKRGFTFKNQTFSGQVTLAALSAKTNALWVLHAQAHEGWLALSTHARITLRQGSIDAAAFTLPAAIPEARVTGDEVRETRSRIVNDRRLYEVQFQNDASDAVEFTVSLELPNPGEIALPAIAFPNAQMVSGFVLAENASDFEMNLRKSGVDPAPTSEIPFLPELSKSASIFRVQPDWSVAVALARLEKAASRSAFVAWAELTSALRRDGTEWHRASYRLQNRSLQFLPVRLPAGAELMSVRVADQSVRADAGDVNGKPAILVPLIKTKPGDLSYDVDVVYRVRSTALGWLARRGLHDPELPGITIERTFWNVWLPGDRALQNSSGNMDAALADLNRAEKLEGKMQELKNLASIINSPGASKAARFNARTNWGLLSRQIQIENGDAYFAETNSYFVRTGATPKPTPAEQSVGKKGIAQQSEDVQRKRRAINEDLGNQVKILADADQQRPQQAPMQMQGRMGGGARPSNAIDQFQIQAPADVSQAQTFGVENQVTQSTERWAANRDYSLQQLAPTTPPPTAPTDVNNLYLNDNIVLQQRIVPPPAKKDVAGEKSPADELQKMTKGETTPDEKLAKNERVAEPANVAGLDTTQTREDQALTLNTARGNAMRFKGQQKAQPQAETAQQLDPATAVAAAPAQAAPAVPGLPAQPTNAPAGPADGGVQAGGEAERLQPAGRISLDVDFPTEGSVLHFKKVKASAQLELTVLEPKSLTRWKYVALALLVAGALFGVQRFWERRVVKRQHA